MEKAGRNDPCPCGSGKKLKKCCDCRIDKKMISVAEVLKGPNKMSSLFNRAITHLPVSNPTTAENEVEE